MGYVFSKPAEGSGFQSSLSADSMTLTLFQLQKHIGCASCFGCKKEQHKGTCRDGLAEELGAIRGAER